MPKTQLTFDEFYQSLWPNRWNTLKSALLAPSSHFARPNLYFKDDPQNLTEFYHMDQASLYPVQALQIAPTDLVLDMCAAPGGKSLICLEQVQEPKQLVLNEFSTPRKHRLIRVLQEYVPEAVRSQIKVTNYDGSLIGLHQKDKYDKILVDAPCSSERHVLQDPEALAAWTPNRSKNLAKRQYALLCSALLALKSGGRIVYATCAISHLENDAVITKLLQKKPECQVVPQEFAVGEKTTHGWQILPDQAQNQGPMYFCILEKP